MKTYWDKFCLLPLIYRMLIVGAVAFPLLVASLPADQKLLMALLSTIAAIGGGLATNLIESVRQLSSPGGQGDARRRYLTGLSKACQLLPLGALGGDEGLGETLTLEEVYIDLDTTTAVPTDPEVSGDNDRASHRDRVAALGRHREAPPLSARAALAQTPWLALLGDPGGGKSTFVRQIVAEIAGQQALGRPSASDLPGHLLPVLMNLRDLTPALQQAAIEHLPAANRRRTLARLVRDQAVRDLKSLEAEDFADGLGDAFENGGCFLVLDGLDELPEQMRAWVREAVRAVTGEYRINQVVVTCRVRSYVAEAVLPDFQAHHLAPFDRAKIETFVKGWYQAQLRLRKVPGDQVASRTQDLTRVATGDLRELAENPMLLTTMAMIHQRDIGLPRERVRLYKLAVDILLRRWEEYRWGKDGLTPDAELAEVLSGFV